MPTDPKSFRAEKGGASAVPNKAPASERGDI